MNLPRKSFSAMLTKRSSALSAIAVIGWMTVNRAFGCECVMPPKSSDEILKGIPVLFEGEIIDVAIESGNQLRFGERITAFRLLHTVKGRIPDTVEVRTPTGAGSCGVYFGEIGERRFVGASVESDESFIAAHV